MIVSEMAKKKDPFILSTGTLLQRFFELQLVKFIEFEPLPPRGC